MWTLDSGQWTYVTLSTNSDSLGQSNYILSMVNVVDQPNNVQKYYQMFRVKGFLLNGIL